MAASSRIPIAALLVLQTSLLSFGCAGAPAVPAPAGAGRTDAALRAHGIGRVALLCNDHRVWSAVLGHEADVVAKEAVASLRRSGVLLPEQALQPALKPLRSAMMWGLVRALIIAGDNNNFSAVTLPTLRTAAGRPVILFRSGLTPHPDQADSCFASLVGAGGVRHVVNLYAGPMVTADLEASERKALEASGGRYFLAREAPAGMANWRDDLRHSEDTAGRQAATAAVAQLINEQILRPGGAAPLGNVHVHCGGGMHRTGMVVGVVDRCLNGTAMATIAADYKRHVGWRSAAQPGGFEPDNLRFIESFDCGLLARP